MGVPLTQCPHSCLPSLSPSSISTTGWTLTLTSTPTGQSAFTYQINPDEASPKGFARAGQHLRNGLRSSILFNIGWSTPTGTCTFKCAQPPAALYMRLRGHLSASAALSALRFPRTHALSMPDFRSDTEAYAVIGGYPTMFLQCAQLSVDAETKLNADGIRELAAGRATLYTLLWTATPANVVSLCSGLTTPGTGNPAVGVSYALDPWSADLAAGENCTAWPCSTQAPFGRRAAAVAEVAGAPRIMFLPRACSGATCVAPFPGTPFGGCPGGKLTMPISSGSWSSSPCNSPQASQGTAAATTVGGAPAAPAPKKEALATKDIIIWLAILTAVFGCFCVSVSAWACARALGAGEATAPAYAPAGAAPKKPAGSSCSGNGNGNGNGHHVANGNMNGHVDTEMHADSV